MMLRYSRMATHAKHGRSSNRSCTDRFFLLFPPISASCTLDNHVPIERAQHWTLSLAGAHVLFFWHFGLLVTVFTLASKTITASRIQWTHGRERKGCERKAKNVLS